MDLIRQAKESGLSVSAEVTPHHLALTDEALAGFDTNNKVAPPLRTHRDAQVLREALANGVLDCVATDHAPHADHEKDVEFAAAPFGVTGLETAFSIVSDLYRSGEISALDLIRRLSTAPARIFGLAGGTLSVGARADVVLLDPQKEWKYDAAEGFSKSRNSPWSGQKITGRVEATFVDGRLVFRADRGVVMQ